MSKRSLGFTLVEMLVVIVIITVLVVASISLFKNVLAKGRDSRRLSDLKIIQGLLQRYYSDQKIYPASSEFVVGGQLRTYKPKIPADPSPTGPNYLYIAQPTGCDNSIHGASCQSYCLYAKLENSRLASITSSCLDLVSYNFEVTSLTHLSGQLVAPTPLPTQSP